MIGDIPQEKRNMTDSRREEDRQTDRVIEQGFNHLGDRIKEVKEDVRCLRAEIRSLPAHAEKIESLGKRIDSGKPHSPEGCPNRTSILWLWGVITVVVLPLIASIAYALIA